MARVTGLIGGSDLVVHPTSHLTEIAARILARGQLDTTWNELQQWIEESVERRWQPALFAILTPYVRRLQVTSDWQYDLARRLFGLVDAVEGTESTITTSFGRSGHGPQPGV